MENQLERYVNGMKNITREQRDLRDSTLFTYHTTRALASIAENDIPEGLENAMEFFVDHLHMFELLAGRESGTDVDEYIAKKHRREVCGELDEGDAEDELEYMDEDGLDAVEAVQNLDDVPAADQMVVDEEMDDGGWPEDYHMVLAPARRSHCRIESPSIDAPVAGPSGLMTEEKEKENTLEMEVEDVAGPSGNPAGNAAPAEVPVKVEDMNRVQYEIMKVAPNDLVVEEAPVTTVEGGEAVVEPKPEPVKPVIPPVVVPWMKKNCKKLRITTHKIVDKDVIEILDSEDELPVEEGGDDEEEDEEGEDGKEPDAQDGGENVPES
jgi:hypothetical protein